MTCELPTKFGPSESPKQVPPLAALFERSSAKIKEGTLGCSLEPCVTSPTWPASIESVATDPARPHRRTDDVDRHLECRTVPDRPVGRAGRSGDASHRELQIPPAGAVGSTGQRASATRSGRSISQCRARRPLFNSKGCRPAIDAGARQRGNRPYCPVMSARRAGPPTRRRRSTRVRPTLRTGRPPSQLPRRHA
jgi:hypothetical protein